MDLMKRVRRSQFLVRIALALTVVGLVAAFQNCSPAHLENSSQNAAALNSKVGERVATADDLQPIRYSHLGVGCDDGHAEATLSREGEVWYLVRDHCQNVEKMAVAASLLDFKPSVPSIIYFGSTLYQREDETGPQIWMACQGSKAQEHVVVDLLLAMDPHSTQLSAEIFESTVWNGTKVTVTSSILKIQKSTAYYVGVDLPKGQSVSVRAGSNGHYDLDYTLELYDTGPSSDLSGISNRHLSKLNCFER